MFIKSENDKQLIHKLSAALRAFYPSLENKSESTILAMLENYDDENCLRQYSINLLALKDPLQRGRWDMFLNAIRSKPETISLSEDKSFLDPSFRVLMQFQKNHYIKVFKSLVCPVIGICYINYDLPTTKMTVDQQLKYVNHQLCETYVSFVPNFANAASYSQTIIEAAQLVYPGIDVLPPHLCQVEIDEIFYYGNSSVWDPTKTNLFYGLFGEPAL